MFLEMIAEMWCFKEAKPVSYFFNIEICILKQSFGFGCSFIRNPCADGFSRLIGNDVGKVIDMEELQVGIVLNP
jgi:hypothetical protein